MRTSGPGLLSAPIAWIIQPTSGAEDCPGAASTGVAMLAMMIEAKINMDCIVVCGKGGSRSIGFVWTAHDLNIHQYQLRTLLEL